MTLTTEVRIAWPVAAERLLDHVTTVAGGDPATVKQDRLAPGDPWYPGSTLLADRHEIRNRAGHGLLTLASVLTRRNVTATIPTTPR